MNHHPVRALAFDFGTRKIGVALGDTDWQASVVPLKTIHLKRSAVPWDTLEHLIQTWQPQLLVVGEALDEQGQPTQMGQRCRAFGVQLQRRTSLPVHYVNEYLSSQHLRYRRPTPHPDSEVAALLLRDYAQRIT